MTETDSKKDVTSGAKQGVPTGREFMQEAGAVGILAILWTLLPALLGFTLLYFLGSISSWLAEQGSVGILVYIGFFGISAGLGLFPTYAQAILGGWVFGMFIGIPAAIIAIVLASFIGYLIARVASGNRVQRILQRHSKSEAIRRALIGRSPLRTLGIITLIRIPPNSPFALTNLLIAACGVPLATCLVGTAIGMLPRTALIIIVAAAARSAGVDNFEAFMSQGRDPWMIGIGLITAIIVLVIIGSIAKGALQRAAGLDMGSEDR